MLAAALILSSLAAGCGSASRADHSAPTSQAAQPAGAAATTHSTPASTPRPGSGGNPQAVPRQCLDASADNPANFALCMAQHGVRISDDPKLTQCIEQASDPAALEKCLLGAGQ